MGRDSSVGIATRYGLDSPGDRTPVTASFSAPVQTGHGVHPASCTMGTRPFQGVKRPERGLNLPHPSSAKVKERVQLYLYYPSGPSWPVIGWTTSLSIACVEADVESNNEKIYVKFKRKESRTKSLETVSNLKYFRRAKT